MERLRHAVLGCVVASLLATACAGEEEFRDASGRVIAPGDAKVTELEVGDCLFPDADDVGDIETIPVVPCEEPHLQEIYFIDDHPADAFPGGQAIVEFADVMCTQALETELGLTLDDGVYFSYLLPTFDGWNVHDDREIICVLVFPVEGEVTGSVVAGTRVIPRVEPADPRPDDAPDDDAPAGEGEGA